MSSPMPHAHSKLMSQTNSVRVENISEHATMQEIIALFNTLIDRVRSSREIHSCSIEIDFYTHEAASKALCMSGYIVAGTALAVTATTTTPTSKGKSDDRRNLYVLGLPFSLTKPEFSMVFSQYGTVSHCVILATVDNSSRRRGFVVMSTHEEAKLAMMSLTRTQLKGHTLDISWAVVQRSHGFLDGGDRTLLLEPRLSSTPLSQGLQRELPDSNSANSSDSSIRIGETELVSFNISLSPTPTLLITNLPTLLFSQVQDLHPLLYPFGHIKTLEIIQALDQGSSTVLVEYESIGVAIEAKESLQTQCYGSYQLGTCYVRIAPSTHDFAQVYDIRPINASAPFGTTPAQLLHGHAGSYNDRDTQGYNNWVHHLKSGLHDNSLHAPPPFLRLRNGFTPGVRSSYLAPTRPYISRPSQFYNNANNHQKSYA